MMNTYMAKRHSRLIYTMRSLCGSIFYEKRKNVVFSQNLLQFLSYFVGVFEFKCLILFVKCDSRCVLRYIYEKLGKIGISDIRILQFS